MVEIEKIPERKFLEKAQIWLLAKLACVVHNTLKLTEKEVATSHSNIPLFLKAVKLAFDHYHN